MSFYAYNDGLNNKCEKFLSDIGCKIIAEVDNLLNIKDSIIFVSIKQSGLFSTLLRHDNDIFVIYDDDFIDKEIKEMMAQKVVLVHEKFFYLDDSKLFMNSILNMLKNKNKKINEIYDNVFDLAFASTYVLEEKEKMEDLVNKDNLTNLYNHSFFQKKLREYFTLAKKTNKIFNVAILDIDFFKKVNDTYGHLAGDKVLKDFAKILKENTRKTDIVARYGGEEFGIIIPDCDKTCTEKVLEKIKDVVTNHIFEFEDYKIKITFSAGFTEYNDKYKSAKEMLANADIGLYMSKNSGRNRFTFVE
ncbi:hypothetical protein DEFDS_1154 [Deferribacter desulfuricans SSM1]|uniref:diguanylate cyclase n=1 Tax=Deferribacter desulfuricans (strain DSM 14783 / JCM 11476 / NBRC 101012 / SSM1) TaxID=639282 RepID=D3PDF0_DEFDS|nr:GGDEF domain-containing protein [Deferribacter desulfuricans]BAI80623.1 hypothetical protein DEFDS_1154 [Deferribacter desulfuricans SSM1]